MATTTESLKARAYAIVEEVRQIPIAADKSHLTKRQRKKEELLKSVPPDELPSVREYVRQFMARAAASERSWQQSNRWLFVKS